MNISVVHIVRQFYPAVGGLENFVKCLATEQIKDGMSVKVITLNKLFHSSEDALPLRDSVDGIEVIRLPYLGSYKYPIAFGVLKYIKGVDVVHVHGVDFFADFIAWTKFFHGKQTVLSTHGGFFHTSYAQKLKLFFFNTITRLSSKTYDAVICCSDNDHRIFKKIVSSNLYIIENGVDINKFSNAGSEKFNKNFLFIGRFSDNKRIDLLIEVFSYITKIDPEYTLCIAGKDWDDNYSNLQALVATKDLANHVTFYIEPTDEEISVLCKSCSTIISLSDYEGFGMTVIEGMAAGLIPLLSSIPSFNKILDDSGLGCTLDGRSPTDIARQILNYQEKLVSNFDELRAKSIEFSKGYSWTYKSTEFKTLYNKILGVKVREIQNVLINVMDTKEVVTHLDNCYSENIKTKVAFANAHTITVANSDPIFLKLLKNFLVLNDGIGIDIASDFKYKKSFPDNLNGTDFIPKYLAETSNKYRIYLVGAEERVVEKAFEYFKNKFPQHSWLGYTHGYIDKDMSLKVREIIDESSVDMVLVGMGNPKQEFWIDEFLNESDVILSFGVGALFDFMSGSVERAPEWLINLKFEWLHRLWKEPRRLWKRYIFGNIIFLYRAILQR